MARIEVFFATNRDVDGTDAEPIFGNRFNAQGPDAFRVGRGEAERSKGVYHTRSIELFPETLAADQPEILGSRRAFADLREQMRKEQRDALLLIHGFASTVAGALERGAELRKEYLIDGKEPIVFVFCWPSDGVTTPPRKYHDDRLDAKLSGPAMARALLRLIEFLRGAPGGSVRGERGLTAGEGAACDQRIHLVAHSMGNYALRWAVQELRERLATDLLPAIFDNVFLMCADEDDDALEDPAKLAPLARLGRAVHVYHSHNDRALEISDLSKGNPNRLGARGPRRLEVLDARINVVDCQLVDWTEPEHGRHQYYRLRREVSLDVRQVLAGVPPELVKGRRATGSPRSWQILTGRAAGR